MTEGTAVAIRPEVGDFKVNLEKIAPDLARVAFRGFTADSVIAQVLEAATKEPKILQATPKSLYLAVMKCARWGLHVGDGVYLVPLVVKMKGQNGERDRYIQTVEAWPSYHGLKALAMRQGIVRHMEEFPVYHGDKFEHRLGLDAYLQHIPTSAANRNGLLGAYSIIRLKGGEKTFHFMYIEDIERIRANSKSWGPDKVKTCPEWYAMKTVVRDYLNRQPKSGALGDALEFDDAAPQLGDGRPANVDADGVITAEVDDLALDQQLAAEDV